MILLKFVKWQKSDFHCRCSFISLGFLTSKMHCVKCQKRRELTFQLKRPLVERTPCIFLQIIMSLHLFHFYCLNFFSFLDYLNVCNVHTYSKRFVCMIVSINKKYAHARFTLGNRYTELGKMWKDVRLFLCTSALYLRTEASSMSCDL